MSRTMQNRGAQALGAAAIFMLAVSGSATALADESGQHSQYQYECHYLNKCKGVGSSLPSPVVLPVDDNAVEYLQLGAGVLAGIGLAGAGLAAASRRSQGHVAHPA